MSIKPGRVSAPTNAETFARFLNQLIEATTRAIRRGRPDVAASLARSAARLAAQLHGREAP
jgi:hypothetical protein